MAEGALSRMETFFEEELHFAGTWIPMVFLWIPMDSYGFHPFWPCFVAVYTAEFSGSGGDHERLPLATRGP